ncbi:hypothetical protein [Rhodoplanes roseus]|uniref:Uncharacterized protein n=1 Tax=Rhodoplanes roseus TaxID=29409 RepID=A0A327KSH4_9BRAD|nr:hypothetical protein [Rhodoplanes roseus]RAI40262.1 hypothetical protein CH341_24150 [Rhodoplanes roseus]
MSRIPLILLASSLLFAVPPVLAAPAADAASAQAEAPKAAAKKKTTVTVRRSRGYGFLPGYEPPDRPSPYASRYDSWIARPYGPGRRYLTPGGWQWVYGWGGARFYQGRWNGGGFGPCWTDTPIGPVWNCGK